MSILTSKVWAGAMDRANACVLPGDIPAALGYFGNVNTLYMHPKTFKSVSQVIPEGIEVVEHPVVALYELWGADNPEACYQPPPSREITASSAEPVKPVVSVILKQKSEAKTSPNRKAKKKRHVSKLPLPVGRPPKTGKVSRVTLWRRKKKAQGVLV